MPATSADTGRLTAVSDLHVRHAENRATVEALHPASPGDWLLVAGDVAESLSDIEWTLSTLSSRFATVVWAPGNHELWTKRDDPQRGVARYERLVELCRELGVLTPEDPYPLWPGPDGPVVVAPLFVGYDYTFRPAGARDKREALEIAYAAGIVCTDEFLLATDPYAAMDDWCAA